MEATLKPELVEIFNKQTSAKAIATIDKNGIPHLVYKNSLAVDKNGNITLYEILESSRNNQNLVYSIWFDKKIAINVLSDDGRSFEIIAQPVKSITAGAAFEETYKKIREKLGDVDLAAIWIIKPLEVREETFSVRVKEEEEKYPLLRHEDRLLKSEQFIE